jgi:membrane fusion protein (multidrug efflux system)
VSAAEADLEKAQLNLDYTNIIAPISGQIDRPTYDVGNLVGPNSGVLATINKRDPIYVNFFASEVAFTQFKQFQLEQAKGQSSQNVAKTNKLFTPFLLVTVHANWQIMPPQIFQKSMLMV